MKAKSEVYQRLKLWYDEHIVTLRQTNENKQDLRTIFFNTIMREYTRNAMISYLKIVVIELTLTRLYTPDKIMGKM